MARNGLHRFCMLMALAAMINTGSMHGQAPAQSERMVQRVYAVADLVVPIDAVKAGMGAASSALAAPVHCRTFGPDDLERIGVDFASPICHLKPAPVDDAKSIATTPVTCERQLIQMLQNTVAPKSWANAGGAGTLEYNAASMALVVHQTPAIQAQVDELLTSLRRLQGVQVAMDIQIVTISDRMFEHLAREFNLNQQPSKLLDGETVAKILDAFQGDRRSCVLHAPKITTFNGQEAQVIVGDERFFVTGMKAERHHGQPVLMPQNERFTTGSKITVQPTVTPDHRNVVVKFHAEVSEMPNATVPLFPVTTFITPIFEGGSMGQPIPFTQFIQQPTVVTRGVKKVFGIPDGQTGFIYAGRCNHTVKHVSRVPVLGDLPLLGELLKSESEGVESNHLIFLLTPRVVLTDDAKNLGCDDPPCDGRKPYVGLMPTSAPVAVVATLNRGASAPRKTESSCANVPCAQSSVLASAAHQDPTVSQNVPLSVCLPCTPPSPIDQKLMAIKTQIMVPVR